MTVSHPALAAAVAERRLATPGPIRLELKIPLGDLEVTTIEGDESTVSFEGSQKFIEATKVELVGDRLVVDLRRKSFGGLFGLLDGALRVRVQIPHDSHVEIVTASGEAALDGRFSGLDVKSASGGVRVSGQLGGSVTVKSVSGEVRLPRVQGALRVQTVSGDVRAEAVEGAVSVKSVSGNLRVGSLEEGSVSVQSVSGDIELGVAPGTSIDIDAGSASGDLSSEVALSPTRADGEGPTVVIRCMTVSGDVRLFRAA